MTQSPAQRFRIIVLDRCVDVPEPDYVIVSRTRCIQCDEPCWLGDQTDRIVSVGGAEPICQPCAGELYLPDNTTPLRTVHDSRKGPP